MPLVGTTAEAVLAGVRGALADGEHVEGVEANRSGEHVDVSVRFDAASAEAADRLAADPHERVLRAVLAAAPAEHDGRAASGRPSALARTARRSSPCRRRP